MKAEIIGKLFRQTRDQISIKKPPGKLEEHLRWIGVQEYLRLKELATDERADDVIKI